MQKLSLLGNVFKAKGAVRNQSLLPCMRLAARSCATGGEGGEKEALPVDPFLRKPSRDLHMWSGISCSNLHINSPGHLIFGPLSSVLTGTGKNTLNTDIIHYLEGCDQTTENVRVEYSQTFASLGMILQFPSRSVFQNAVRSTIRKGHLYKLEEVDRGLWDVQTSYFGKVALLSGIPCRALAEDAERFLSCCDFDASSLQMFSRAGFPEPIRIATVRFPSQIEATNAISMKNRSFILSNLVTMKLLQ